jgi:uncharacterized membrane protein (DUF2068 family)
MATCHNGLVAEHRFFDKSQPQTLQGAVVLSYLTLAFSLLSILAYGAGLALLPVALGVGAYGIANERRWGYWLAVVAAGLYVLQSLTVLAAFHVFSLLINLLFAVVLAVMLLHRQSREYQRIWFH